MEGEREGRKGRKRNTDTFQSPNWQMPQHSISARYGNVNNHYITSLWVYNWSLFYSSYFSVLPYFVQWIYISFIIREKRDTSKEKILDYRAFFSGFWPLTILLTPSIDLEGKSVVLLPTIPWQEVDQSQVAGIFRSLTPCGSVACAGSGSVSHLRLFGISEPTISILDSGILSLCYS